MSTTRRRAATQTDRHRPEDRLSPAEASRGHRLLGRLRAGAEQAVWSTARRGLGVVSVLLVATGCPSGSPVATPSETETGSSSGGLDGSSDTVDDELDGSTTDASSTEEGSEDTGTETTDAGPICGDGIVEGDEACDDEGESPTCNADCTPAACGDGVLNAAAGEACDDAGESATCNADCTTAMCGDGVTNATAGEACDDGGESASCDVDCTLAECGDGVFNASASEECDGAGRTAACDQDCTLAECGDGYVNPMAPEQCDDGGESTTCNVDCTIAVCGDGVTNATAGEDCDDAGESASCDADCTSAVCGDGDANATAGEACDGLDLAGSTCEAQGYPGGGTLACDGGCGFDTSGCSPLPATPTLQLTFSQVKQFDFSWMAALGADYYQLEQSAAPGEPFVQLGMDIVVTSVSHTMPLHFRYQASYRLQACNAAGCSQSAVVDVVSSLADAVGYFKASNTDSVDWFGTTVALSSDGNTLAVAAFREDSNATGIGGDEANNFSGDSGAVYVFSRDGMGTWAQEAYVKASNTGPGDQFGCSVALSNDGNTLAVGAFHEDSNATGVGGDETNNSSGQSGAVYVFSRDGMGTWSQEAYVKASNTETGDTFGATVALSGDGNTLAVTASGEDSNATGIDGDQADNSYFLSGAVYVYSRDGMGTWAQEAYVKASNTELSDHFGGGLALSEDGNTLAVGARGEDSNATGIGGDQADNSSSGSGAVYVFGRDGMGTWAQEAYVKASTNDSGDAFGWWVALSGDGNTLAVSAYAEDSNATGIGGDQADNSSSSSGAVLVFSRDGMGSWSQEAYVKASNTDSEDQFGYSVALSSDGLTLAVAAHYEDGNATGIGGDQTDNSFSNSGAVYVYSYDGMGTWSQEAYVKASNTSMVDRFATSVALQGDGSTLAVGAFWEDSDATGIGGDQANDASGNSGAVYLY